MSVVVNPVAWNHYLVLLLIPVAIAGRLLSAQGLSQRKLPVPIFMAVLLVIVPVVPRESIILYAGSVSQRTGRRPPRQLRGACDEGYRTRTRRRTSVVGSDSWGAPTSTPTRSPERM